MVSYKPVTLNKASFAFCRISMAILIWVAFFLKSELLLILVSLNFLISAIVRVQHAPLIRLYDLTMNRIKKSPEIVIDSNSIFFAHSLAFVLSLICILLVYLIGDPWTWRVVLLFAILKSISAMGYCPASKLYNCALNGKCCVTSLKNE